jgi:hypothetical protein
LVVAVADLAVALVADLMVSLAAVAVAELPLVLLLLPLVLLLLPFSRRRVAEVLERFLFCAVSGQPSRPLLG